MSSTTTINDPLMHCGTLCDFHLQNQQKDRYKTNSLLFMYRKICTRSFPICIMDSLGLSSMKSRINFICIFYHVYALCFLHTSGSPQGNQRNNENCKNLHLLKSLKSFLLFFRKRNVTRHIV